MSPSLTVWILIYTKVGPQTAPQAELQNQDEPRPSVWIHRGLQPAESDSFDEWQLSEDGWRGIAEAAHVAPEPAR